MSGLENLVLEWTRQLYQAVGWPGVVFLMAIESACIPFPSEVIMPLAGWMLLKELGLGPQYLLLAGFYGALGNLLGSLVAYGVGAWGGRPLVERYGRYVLLSRHDLDRADQWFARWGEWAVFFSRLLPVVRTFISLPAGIARMSLKRFVIFSFAGSFPWSLGLAYGGYLLGEHWERLRSVMRPFDIPILAVIVALIAYWVWRRVRSLRRGSAVAGDTARAPENGETRR